MTSLQTIEVGDALASVVIEHIDPARIKLASAILDDPNPIHFDVEQVRRLGLGDATVNHGPLNLGYLVNLAIDFAGGPACLRAFRGRFLGNVFAGDRVECRGMVAAIDPERREVTLELSATVGDRPVMAAEATVALA